MPCPWLQRRRLFEISRRFHRGMGMDSLLAPPSYCRYRRIHKSIGREAKCRRLQVKCIFAAFIYFRKCQSACYLNRHDNCRRSCAIISDPRRTYKWQAVHRRIQDGSSQAGSPARAPSERSGRAARPQQPLLQSSIELLPTASPINSLARS